MGKTKRTKTFFLWFIGIFALLICLAGAIYFRPGYVINHTSSLNYTSHLIGISIVCILLISLLFKGTHQIKKICPFALSSVICLSLAPIYLCIAMILDDGFNEYIVSGFLFNYCMPFFLYTSPIIAIVSLYYILYKKKQWAGLLFSIAVLGLFTCEILIPFLAKQYKRRYPHPGLVCQIQMRILYKTIQVYANDYDGKLPTASKWCDLLKTYSELDKKHLQCPRDKKGPCSYAMNKFVSSINDKENVVLIFESKPGWNQVGREELFNTGNHDGKGGFVLFTNGSIKLVKSEELSLLQWQPK